MAHPDDPDTDLGAFERPASGGADAEAMKQRIASRIFGAQAGPVCIGRFEVVESIGAGGMGIVYRARDPRLRRQVALKLLHPHLVGRGEERARQLCEAQALAKLSHPNVVQLYEVGELDDGLFLAMEYVDGVSLSRWRSAAARGWQEVIAVYLQAGQGLAAAHAAGLVHRDFKPANVLLGSDGRARVADFGLARGPGLVAESPTPSSSSASTPSPSDRTATRSGVRVGTPEYMSPEQRRHEAVDARSDQFSYCVSVWEALFRERPGTDRGVGGPPRPVPTKAGVVAMPRSVQRRLVQVLGRGLRSEPADRWPSMDALLEAIAAVGPRSRWGSGGVVLGLGLMGALGWYWSMTRAHPVCDALHRAEPSWSAADRKDVEAAAHALGVEGHEVIEATVNDTLTDWVAEWGTVAEQVCEEAREGEAVSARRECLEGVARRLQRIGEVLRKEEDALLGAPEALALLVPPGVCRRVPELVLSEAEAGIEEDALRELVRAQVDTAAGRHDAALETYRGLEDRVSGSASALGARVELGRGEAHYQRRDLAEARAHFEDAAAQAMALDARATAASALSRLVWVAVSQEAFENASWNARLCLAQTADEATAPWRAECRAALGVALAGQGKLMEATRELEAAVATEHPIFGDRQPSQSRWLQALANIYADLDERDEARAIYEQERARYLAAYGSRHPVVLVLDFNLALLDEADGDAASEAGDARESARCYDRAHQRLSGVLAGFEAVYGRTVTVASPLVALARVELARGEPDVATRHIERAITLQQALPVDHSERGAALNLAREIAEARVDLPAALALSEAASQVHGARATGERPMVWLNVAYYRCILRACEGAADALDHVNRETQAANGDDAGPHIDNVKAMLAISRGDALYARDYAEHVLRRLQAGDLPNGMAFEAEARWTLARAASIVGNHGEATNQASRALALIAGDAFETEVFRRLDAEMYERNQPQSADATE